jgi:hypothetical protein
MGMNSPTVKYTGSALPGNAEVVVMFTTTANGYGANFFASTGTNRFLLALVNDQTGTLASQKSTDRGVTWTTISSDAVSASATNDQNYYDYLVEPYADWRLVWTNGATPQTSFKPSMALVNQRNVAT